MCRLLTEGAHQATTLCLSAFRYQHVLPSLNHPQHAIEAGLDSAHLADLLPGVWADFIRNADMSDVRPLGTRSIEVVRSKYSMQP